VKGDNADRVEESARKHEKSHPMQLVPRPSTPSLQNSASGACSPSCFHSLVLEKLEVFFRYGSSALAHEKGG
jgi:hypothetical protein